MAPGAESTLRKRSLDAQAPEASGPPKENLLKDMCIHCASLVRNFLVRNLAARIPKFLKEILDPRLENDLQNNSKKSPGKIYREAGAQKTIRT